VDFFYNTVVVRLSVANRDTPSPSVRNITRVFRMATPAEIAEGAQWYADAYEIAVALAAKSSTTVEIAAGVIAALSPLKSWGTNVNLAARFLAAGGLHEGYLRSQLAKARAILAGADIEATLSGDKTVNFYHSIATAGAKGVTIDRHAWALAVNIRYEEGTMPTLKGKRYALAVDAYTRAAKILSREYGTTLTPAMVQSVTWVLWRRKFWSATAWDSYDEVV
jgi:hypothetical protein